jgi:hypothetical protein
MTFCVASSLIGLQKFAAKMDGDSPNRRAGFEFQWIAEEVMPAFAGTKSMAAEQTPCARCKVATPGSGAQKFAPLHRFGVT